MILINPRLKNIAHQLRRAVVSARESFFVDDAFLLSGNLPAATYQFVRGFFGHKDSIKDGLTTGNKFV